VTEPQTVHIVEITSGISTTVWLCPACIESRKAAGWTVKVLRQIEQPCDDCTRGALALSACDFVPTGPGARRPTATECPPPRKIPPWPKPKKAAAPKREPTTWNSDDEEAA